MKAGCFIQAIKGSARSARQSWTVGSNHFHKVNLKTQVKGLLCNSALNWLNSLMLFLYMSFLLTFSYISLHVKTTGFELHLLSLE